MKQLEQQVEHYFSLADAYFSESFPRPFISLNKRNSKVAASANITYWRLSFNQHFYLQQPLHFLKHTVAHEVAHLVCAHVYGKVRPHGAEWQSIMTAVFKLPATRTHNYSLKHMQTSQFTYACHCQQHQLGIRRHNKVLRKEAKYLCKHCGSELVWQQAA